MRDLRTAAALLCLIAPLAARAAPLTVSVTDTAGRPLADAVVYVVVKGLPARASAGATARIAQKGKQFEPRVSVVQTGTPVQFPNDDAVRHHVYSFSPVRAFELKLYAGTPSEPIVFDKAGTAVLGCNIHDRMTAWVHVVDTPFFAKTDADGRAVLDIPAGAHRLRAWHHLQPEEAVPAEQPLQMAAAAGAASVRLAVGTGR